MAAILIGSYLGRHLIGHRFDLIKDEVLWKHLQNWAFSLAEVCCDWKLYCLAVL